MPVWSRSATPSERFRVMSRELDEAWIGILTDTISEGVASGGFDP